MKGRQGKAKEMESLQNEKGSKGEFKYLSPFCQNFGLHELRLYPRETQRKRERYR